MATNLTGYQGSGHGRTDVVQAILRTPAFNVNMPAALLAPSLFVNNFMPYARTHWPYDGPSCNCEDLAEALMTTWLYVKEQRRLGGNPAPLPVMERATTFDSAEGMITKVLPVVGGLARGNVISAATGATDGRCLFPNHTFCKLAQTYFDPTFCRMTPIRDFVVLRKLTRKVPTALWFYKSGNDSFIYAIPTVHRAPRFSCSYHELDGNGWITAQDWKTKTARTGHTRSKELHGLDAALEAFEDPTGTGNGGFLALPALKTAFEAWAKRNPEEAKKRNAEGCVVGLARFLGVNLRLLGVNIV